MPKKTKETEEIEELSARIQEEETKKPSSFKKRFKAFVILFLSLLCLVGGALIYNMRTFSFDTKSTLSTIEANKRVAMNMQKASLGLKPVAPQVAVVPTDLSQNEVFAEESVIIDAGKNTATLAKIETAQEDTTAVEIAEIVEQNNSSDIVYGTKQETSVTPKSTKIIGFSLQDALLFKEHFLTESSCYDDYQKLLYAKNKTPQALDVLNDLSPYCLSHQEPVENVRIAFLNDKKKALIASYKENNPLWLAYIKAIPASLIEFRKINPKSEKPKDLLFKAQNELYRQNVAKAVAYVTKLPLSMQREMKGFYREAAIYNRAKMSIDQLILSFEDKGE